MKKQHTEYDYKWHCGPKLLTLRDKIVKYRERFENSMPHELYMAEYDKLFAVKKEEQD